MTKPPWRNMDSAPRDGTSVLLLVIPAAVPLVRIAWWDEGERLWWGYVSSISRNEVHFAENPSSPTFWMPLPEITEEMMYMYGDEE